VAKLYFTNLPNFISIKHGEKGNVSVVGELFAKLQPENIFNLDLYKGLFHGKKMALISQISRKLKLKSPNFFMISSST
jgi:hypothetical protein